MCSSRYARDSIGIAPVAAANSCSMANANRSSLPRSHALLGGEMVIVNVSGTPRAVHWGIMGGAVGWIEPEEEEDEWVGDTERVVLGVKTVAVSHRLRSVVVTFRNWTNDSG